MNDDGPLMSTHGEPTVIPTNIDANLQSEEELNIEEFQFWTEILEIIKNKNTCDVWKYAEKYQTTKKINENNLREERARLYKENKELKEKELTEKEYHTTRSNNFALLGCIAITTLMFIFR